MPILPVLLMALLGLWPITTWGQAEEPGAPVFEIEESPGKYHIVNGQTTVGAGMKLRMSTSYPKGQIFYTTNGAVANFSSTRYESPLILRESFFVRAISYNSDFSQSKTNSLHIEVLPQFTLKVQSSGGGAVFLDPPGPQYLSNTVVQVNAVDAEGFFFVEWHGAVQSTNRTIEVRMNTNQTLNVLFHRTVDLSTTGGGRIVTNQPSGPWGDWLVLTAVPDPGHYFGAWGGGLVGNNNPGYVFLFPSTEPVSAVFGVLADDEVTVIPYVNGKSAVIRMDPQKNVFKRGETVTLSVDLRLQPEYYPIPYMNSGAFKGWSGDVESYEHPLKLTLNETMHVRANIEDNYKSFARVSKHPGARVAIGNDGTVYISSVVAIEPTSAKLTAFAPDGTVKWTRTFTDSGISNPSVGESGTIYVGSPNATICAISPSNELLWRWVSPDPLPDESSRWIRSADLKIGENETIYSPSGDLVSSRVYEVRDGTLLRMLPSMPSIGPDGTLYYKVGNETVAELNSGELKWKLPIEVPQVVSHDGTLYASANGLKARDSNGNLLWSHERGGSYIILGQNNETIFVPGLIAFNSRGETLWTGSPGQIAARYDGGIYSLDVDRFYLDIDWNYQARVRTYDALGQATWFAHGGGGEYYGISAPPVIGPDMTIFFAAGDGIESWLGHIASFRGDSLFAKSSWSMHGGNPQNTGRSEPLLRKLRVEVSGDGTVQKTPEGTEQELLGSVTLRGQPAEGQIFVRWSGDVDSTENPLQLLMDSHKKVVAVFEPKPVIRFSLEAQGLVLSVDGAPGQSYRLQASDNLISWETYADFEGSLSTPVPLSDNHQFFRVTAQ